MNPVMKEAYKQLQETLEIRMKESVAMLQVYEGWIRAHILTLPNPNLTFNPNPNPNLHRMDLDSYRNPNSTQTPIPENSLVYLLYDLSTKKRRYSEP